MAPYRLLKHKDFEQTARDLPPSVKQKALWAQVMLGTRGRTPRVKGTSGLNARWRRTPVQGNHYYMWWIPASESIWAGKAPIHEQTPPDLTLLGPSANGHSPSTDFQSILIHSIRHHDDTDTPLDLGSLHDYEEIPISALDPRFEEQRRVSKQVRAEKISLATIKGLPGSGKTVSLIYLVKDLAQRTGDGQILYVTYTSRLKRAAQEFIQAQDEAVRARIKVCTLSEIESEIAARSIHIDPFGELPRFVRFLNTHQSSSLGLWRKYPQTFYTELRAHVFGRTFPPAYAPGDNVNSLSMRLRTLDLRDAQTFANQRGIDITSAQIAHQLANSAEGYGLFQDQMAARHTMTMLLAGQAPNWLFELDALVVDEIQDLTLLQIALLGEMARTRIAHDQTTPFVFTVAGDESQIVQPSGFDWGVTKELLGEILGTWPEEFEFRHQRRAPRNLAQLIDNSWGFYGELARQHRPSARREFYADPHPTSVQGTMPEEVGRIQVCAIHQQPESEPAPSRTKGLMRAAASPPFDWIALLEELSDKPGRALIDLTERLCQYLAQASEGTVAQRATQRAAVAHGEEVLFLPREIKGLERTTVLVYGLQEVYERALSLIHDESGSNIPIFEARRLFDEIRVALSRTTTNLILLEAHSAPVLEKLGITTLAGYETVTPEELLESLRLEEMSEIEVIEGFLDEVDDLFERGRWEYGYRRNRRAHHMALQLGDLALQREVQEQYITGHVLEAANHLATNDWQQAHERNRHAMELAVEFADPLVMERVDEQRCVLVEQIVERVRQMLAHALDWADRNSFKIARRDARSALELAELIDEEGLISLSTQALSNICWRWAYQLTNTENINKNIEHGATLLDEAAYVLERQSEKPIVMALKVLAERYHKIVPAERMSESQVRRVLKYAEQFMDLIAPVPGELDPSVFIGRWLEETYQQLGDRARLYFDWVNIAQVYANASTYAVYDERVWDLENRFEMWCAGKSDVQLRELHLERFRAFLLAENGEYEAASDIWERLGDIHAASALARKGGDIIRAFELLRRSREEIPKGLKLAMDAMQLLERLTTEHESLLPGERRTIAARMEDLGQRMVTEQEANVEEVEVEEVEVEEVEE